MSQVNDNLGADTVTLRPGDLAALDEITRPSPMPLDWLKLTLDEQTKKAPAERE